MPVTSSSLLTLLERAIGYLPGILGVLVSLIGLRLLAYFYDFFRHWEHYRGLPTQTTGDLMRLPTLPYLKIQITTRGTTGSTVVIRRVIRSILDLVYDAPSLYGLLLSVEIVTENAQQKTLFEQEFAHTPLDVQVFVVPPDYQTARKTLCKARAMHHMVEQRRQGRNSKPGRTFILHCDEESIMPPRELKKLLYYLATTKEQILMGPLYSSLQYRSASTLCRVLEAHRPLHSFECHRAMLSGLPSQVYGTHFVIDEELENALGWDIGNFDGKPILAEGFLFGLIAYLRYGRTVFGWHGCSLLEQPAFTYRSAFEQRYRQTQSLLQSIALIRMLPDARKLPLKTRALLIWSACYQLLTDTLSLPASMLAFGYTLYQSYLLLNNRLVLPLPLSLSPLLLWFAVVSILWLNTFFIGAWYNVSYAELSRYQRVLEILRVLALAPLAGIMESVAACWAIGQWIRGKRLALWQPTPKTLLATRGYHASTDKDDEIVLPVQEQRLRRFKELRRLRESRMHSSTRGKGIPRRYPISYPSSRPASYFASRRAIRRRLNA